MGSFEAYPHYERFLHQGALWPSESNGDTVVIADMVPRYASAALDKLMRWASTMSAQAHVNIYDRTERIRHVRNSRLAEALALRAAGQPLNIDPGELPAEVTPRDIILTFAPIIAEHTDLDITTIFKLCEKLAAAADEEWTITLMSR